MAIKDLRGGQVAVLCVALALGGAMLWGAFSAWEHRQASAVEAGSQADAMSLRVWELSTRTQGRTASADSILYWMQLAQLERIEAARRHNEIRAVVHPFVLLLTLVAVPGAVSFILWRWYGTRP